MTGPKCGTATGYRHHMRDKTPTCQPCRDNRAVETAEYRKRRYLARGKLSVDALGTVRRLHALAAIGWTSAHIAERMGSSMNNVQNLYHSKVVRLETARRVADAYEQMSGTPGPSVHTRRRAAAKGWAPPLAWDEGQIDNPDAVSHLQIEADHAEALVEEERRHKVEIRKARMQWLMEHQPGEYERQRKAKQESSRITKANRRARARQARAA